MACGPNCTCRPGMGECATRPGPCHSTAKVSAAERRRFKAAERIAREAERRARAAGIDPERAETLARQAGYGALLALEAGHDEQSARRQALDPITDSSGPERGRAPQRAAQAVRRPAKEQVRTAGSVLGGLALLSAGIGTIYWILKTYG